MVSFSCEACGDILTKKKLDPHRNQCRGATFTCIDCMVHFQGTQYRAHTSCMTEAQKYQGALYREKPNKNQRNGRNDPKQNQKPNNRNNNNNNNNNNSHRAPYVEDAPDADNSKANAPPPAPTPPLAGSQKASAPVNNNTTKDVNVFDYLVTENTPNASKVSLGGPKEQMQMVDHAPSVFEASKSLAHCDTEGDDDNKAYDVAYEEHGFSYGEGPIPPSMYPNKASNNSVEFMTPAPKKKKDRTRANGDVSATTSDKKRKRRTEDHEMEDADTPMLEAPSSVLNHPGTPMLNHSGLTGGLNRMLRSPSLDGEEDHPRRRFQDPSSPIKRTRRDEKEDDAGLGISMKNRAGRLVSSMFGGSVVSGSSANGHESAPKAMVRTRRRSSSDDGRASNQPEDRRSKKVSRKASANEQADAADSRKTKRKSSVQTDGDRPSRRLKQVEHADHKRERSPTRGEDGQVVVYQQLNIPNEVQLQMASHFMSLVTKGPDSGRGFSMNKVLKRFHRDFTDEFDGDRGREQGRSRADRERRTDDEKDLWRTLRVKQNERGEVVLFF